MLRLELANLGWALPQRTTNYDVSSEEEERVAAAPKSRRCGCRRGSTKRQRASPGDLLSPRFPLRDNRLEHCATAQPRRSEPVIHSKNASGKILTHGLQGAKTVCHCMSRGFATWTEVPR